DAVDTAAVPVKIVVIGLDRGRHEVWPEQGGAFAAGRAYAAIEDAIAACIAQLAGQRLRWGIIVGVMACPYRPCIMQLEIEAGDQHAELRGPARRLIGAAHDFCMMMGHFADR